MNNYETVFILTPVLSDAQMKEAVEKFKTLLTDKGAEIINEENWGIRKLAYPIDKKSTGFYNMLEFSVDHSVLPIIKKKIRRDERVLRFLTTKHDKFSFEYSEKRRRNRSSKKDAASTTETAKPEVKYFNKE